MLAGVLAAAASQQGLASTPFDAVLSSDGRSVDGVPGYRTLAQAMAAARAAPPRTVFRVRVPVGAWRGCTRIDVPGVQLVGDDPRRSILICDERANAPRPADAPGATLEVVAPDFRATRLTIANDFDYPHNQPPPVPYDRTGASGAQATALRLTGRSDRAVLQDCRITGWQDTLFAEVGRSLFRNCFVSGCVDFIYGGGVAVFDHCEILSRTIPGKDFHGFIAAPNTNRRQAFGLVFLDCRLTKDAGMAPHTVALGRPWRRTGTFPDGRYGDPDAVGQAAFIRCWMDDHIVREGWYPMHYNLKSGQRVMYEPEDARLFEYASRGPGRGLPSARRRRLTSAQAGLYTIANLFAGWTPR